MAEPAAPARAEEAALVAVQSALASRPGALLTARALSFFGEHSLGWLALAGLGALLSPGRRRAFVTAGIGTFAAHAAAARDPGTIVEGKLARVAGMTLEADG